MKSKAFKSIVLAFLTLLLWSCEKQEDKTVATAGTGGTLKSSAAAVTIDKSVLTTNVITFTLTNADFGYQAAVNNVLQLAVKGTNFANAKEAILPANATTKVYTGFDFNNLLLALNLSTSVNSDVEVRIKSTISNNVAPVYSNVVTLSAKPFPLTAWIYVPGNYQGWDPATADSLASVTGNGIYTGIIAFDGGNFKITPQKKWDNAYGAAGAGKISTTGGDISSVSAGLKKLTVNLNTNEIKIEDAVNVWSLIGNATPGGWDVDTKMKLINDGSVDYSTWVVKANFVAGKYKFRYAGGWGTNLGGGANLTLGGGDIDMATPGNYTVTLKVNYSGFTQDGEPIVSNGSYTIVKN